MADSVSYDFKDIVAAAMKARGWVCFTSSHGRGAVVMEFRPGPEARGWPIRQAVVGNQPMVITTCDYEMQMSVADDRMANLVEDRIRTAWAVREFKRAPMEAVSG